MTYIASPDRYEGRCSTGGRAVPASTFPSSRWATGTTSATIAPSRSSAPSPGARSTWGSSITTWRTTTALRTGRLPRRAGRNVRQVLAQRRDDRRAAGAERDCGPARPDPRPACAGLGASGRARDLARHRRLLGGAARAECRRAGQPLALRRRVGGTSRPTEASTSGSKRGKAPCNGMPAPAHHTFLSRDA
jgi:hypothetical protein